MKPTDRVSQLAARHFEAPGADLLRFLRQRLGSDAAARDIAQEAYLRFIRLDDPDRIDNPEVICFVSRAIYFGSISCGSEAWPGKRRLRKHRRWRARRSIWRFLPRWVSD